MKKAQMIGTAVICTTVLFLASTGCSHKKTREEEGGANTGGVESTELGSSDSGNAMGLETVHFDYDSNLLTSKAKQILRRDASVLKAHQNVSLQVEGHCDARGGIQYNLALGQRRADAVQHFLVDQGVSSARVTTISYGKEKPLVSGDTEQAYAKNRRANLIITKK